MDRPHVHLILQDYINSHALFLNLAAFWSQPGGQEIEIPYWKDDW